MRPIRLLLKGLGLIGFIWMINVFLLPWVAMAEEVGGRVYEVAPGEDYIGILRQLEPGDELVFLPGVHVGHAVVGVSGVEGRPITIRGKMQDGERPELQFTGRGHNLWRIRASHLEIRDLAFHATHAYGIRVDAGKKIRIDNCIFRDCGGGDLSANSGNVDGLVVRHSRFIGSRRTPVYIGNHQGGLEITDFVFENNVIDGSRIEGDGVGYGIQLKLNVRGGVIRENFITGTKGPGIMVYGSEGADPKDAQVVERNIVIGARNNPGIVVGGGPATVRGNIVLGNRSGGILVMNYGGRDLLDHVRLEGNVAAVNRSFDYSVRGGVRKFVAAGNVAYVIGGGGMGVMAGEGGNREEEAGEALVEWVAGLAGKVPGEAEAAALWRRLEVPVGDGVGLMGLFE